MITNDEELAVVLKQLARIERALESLRRDVLPKNKRNFEVLSEGYVDQIAALREEIDAYRGVVKKPIEAVENGSPAARNPDQTWKDGPNGEKHDHETAGEREKAAQ